MKISELLSDESKWEVGRQASSADGESVWPDDENAVRWCLIGAACKCSIRWIYANGTPSMGCGNFFVCATCDGGDERCLERAKSEFEQAKLLARRWGLWDPDKDGA